MADGGDSENLEELASQQLQDDGSEIEGDFQPHVPIPDFGDDEDASQEEDQKPKKRAGKKTHKNAAKKEKTKKNEDGQLAGNQIKTGNRLVGVIENNELYGADDDVQMINAEENEQPFYEDRELMDIDPTQKLDLGSTQIAQKKDFSSLFGKLKSKGETTGIQSKIKNLGFQKDISLNELAAAGIKISLKDQLKEQLAKAEETFAERLKKDDSVDQEKPLDGIISS